MMQVMTRELKYYLWSDMVFYSRIGETKILKGLKSKGENQRYASCR
jgi:hypothetical protein